MREGVRIADGGLTAQWAAWRSALARRTGALAALDDGERPRLFVEGELLVNLDDERTMALLRGRDGVLVEPSRDVPPAPEGMDREKARPLDGMPRIAKVRFDGRGIGQEALLDLARERDLGDLDLAVTSPAGLGTLSLAAELILRGARVMPNSVGRSLALPRGASTEDSTAPGGPNAYTWPEFAGDFGFPRAWQLIEAYRQLRTTASPTIDVGILDGGFWLVDGMPGAPPGRPPEFPAPVLQWNLCAEGQHSGGPNPAGEPRWHGQMVASLCVGPHDDNVGVAGAGGTIARPFLFKCDLSDEQVIRGVQCATAWGLDVMNMSFAIEPATGPFAYTDGYDENAVNDMFQWGTDNGLVIVAGAGNWGHQLPDHDVRPATRTPGVITVGALDGNVRWREPARSADFSDWHSSNYGESVDIWAQGAMVHVGPTPDEARVSRQSGTSGSAPIVAGTVAMMKFVDPTLKTPRILEVLQETARNSPDPKVTWCLNAGAAVWEVMGRRLPSDFGEADGGPASARPLQSEPNGTLVASTIGARAISDDRDVDWYVFSVEDFSMLTVDLAFAAGMATASVVLVPDDPDSRALEDLGEGVRSPGRHRLGPALVAPGTYRLKVTGGVTLYELRVQAPTAPLPSDAFEGNDTPERATLFTLRTDRLKRLDDPVLDVAHRRGTYELSLHRPSDVDFLHVTHVPAISGALEPILSISRTDAPVDVALVNAEGAVEKEWIGERAPRVVLPEGEAWVRISARSPSRYSLRVNVEADPTKVPVPPKMVPPSPFSEWWPDPPWELHGWEQYLEVLIDPEVARTPGLRLSGPAGLTLDLLAQDGTHIAASEPIGDGELHLPLDGVRPGTYIVRVGRDLEPAARLAPGALQPARFSLGPVL
jgi:hypothetical protein